MRPAGILVTVSFLTLAVAFWNRNALPGNIDYVASIFEEPTQTSTRKRAFDAVFNNTTYRVEPEYDYDLTGMVVSFRHHEGNSRMHRRSNDHLNMLDVCVIWGENTANPRLDRLKFWNGIFTCNVQTRDNQAWAAFDMYKLSNNHLLSDRDSIRDSVRDIRIGDQIRVRGYLASYSNPAGGRRGTSTTRLDTGDGACETIYVEDFEIVRAATSRWRQLMWGSLAIFLVSLFAWFRRPYKPYSASA